MWWANYHVSSACGKHSMRVERKSPKWSPTAAFWKYNSFQSDYLLITARGALSLKSDALWITSALWSNKHTMCKPCGSISLLMAKMFYSKMNVYTWRALSCTSPPTKWLLILAISIKIIKFIYSWRWSISALCFSTGRRVNVERWIAPWSCYFYNIYCAHTWFHLLAYIKRRIMLTFFMSAVL